MRDRQMRLYDEAYDLCCYLFGEFMHASAGAREDKIHRILGKAEARRDRRHGGWSNEEWEEWANKGSQRPTAPVATLGAKE